VQKDLLKSKNNKKQTAVKTDNKPVLKLVKVTDVDLDELPKRRRKAS